MATINTTTIITSTLPTLANFSQYYSQFKEIQGVLHKFSLPYIFLLGVIGLITNTSTVLLLSKNYITKNLKNKWTLIALGRFYWR